MQLFLLLLLLFFSGKDSCAGEQLYAVATTAAPVLSTADFSSVFGGSDGRTLQQDRCGLIRAVEFVAFPGTVFTIEGEIKSGLHKAYRVTTADYPYPARKGYFIDSRAVRIEKSRPLERLRKLPPKQVIIDTMRSRVGTGYVWGGNLAGGVAELADWYGLKNPVAGGRRPLDLAGLDCSGLLYEATGGYTPRNTSALLAYGIGLPVAGKGVTAISAQLAPLDLLVWPGHVMIVLDDNEIIESRLVCGKPDEGVRVRPIKVAIAELLKSRQPADFSSNPSVEFLVRRWYGLESGR